jgi:hypothetical protein
VPHLGDFRAQFAVAWDSEGSARAMQALSIHLHGECGIGAVRLGYYDNSARLEGDVNVHVNDRPRMTPGPSHSSTVLAKRSLLTDRAVFTIERTGSRVTVLWGDEVAHTGTSNLLIKELVIRFARPEPDIAGARPFFGSVSLDRVVIEGTPQAPAIGDLDCDGNACVSDLLVLLSTWGTESNGPPDLDGDGIVGVWDCLDLLANWACTTDLEQNDAA